MHKVYYLLDSLRQVNSRIQVFRQDRERFLFDPHNYCNLLETLEDECLILERDIKKIKEEAKALLDKHYEQ